MRGIVLLLIFFGLSAKSQVSTIEYKPYVVQQMQNVYLNSATRIGGKTRNAITVDLPTNTVEWYYSFTTSENPPQGNVLNLASQLTAAFTGSKVAGEVLKDLFSPTGAAVCDIYLLTEDNVGKFINKADLGFGSYQYLPSGTRENIKNSVVKVNAPLSGRYYLGLKNPSGTVGLNIQIEVIAIVKEIKVDNSKWSNDIINKFHNTLVSTMSKRGIANDMAVELSNCIVSQVKEKYTPESINSLPAVEQDRLIEGIANNCKEKLQPKNESNDQAILYGNLGWKSFEQGNIDKCIEYSLKAISLDSSIATFKYNLGLCYLLKNNSDLAASTYIDAIMTSKKGKFASIVKDELKAAIKDIEDAEKKSNLTTGKEIKGLLESELSNF